MKRRDITREDIDEAGDTVRHCCAEEIELIERFGLSGKPKEVQDILCPELKRVRERHLDANRFLERHN